MTRAVRCTTLVPPRSQDTTDNVHPCDHVLLAGRRTVDHHMAVLMPRPHPARTYPRRRLARHAAVPSANRARAWLKDWATPWDTMTKGRRARTA